ncbi:MAG: hypothetical protein CMG00_05130 [Candidatus Marinimicrobia bacterium]|nr:hypothetical protein [Candidatus Neomarinimicrobiota bacterium]|tara:strand:- start:4461 stop:4880 length:420 start_codon:yes stop_codon:yes gene_type:complete
MNTYIIRLPKISCFGYHGCYEIERKEGQKFEVDIEIKFKDNDNSLLNDELRYTIDYIKIEKLVQELVGDENKKFRCDLLERLANDVSKIPYKLINNDTYYEYRGSLNILLVKVRIRKTESSFIGAPYVEVEYIRDRYDK